MVYIFFGKNYSRGVITRAYKSFIKDEIFPSQPPSN